MPKKKRVSLGVASYNKKKKLREKYYEHRETRVTKGVLKKKPLIINQIRKWGRGDREKIEKTIRITRYVKIRKEEVAQDSDLTGDNDHHINLDSDMMEFMENNQTEDKSFHTIPSFLTIKKLPGSEYGVFAKETIPLNTRLGPVEGTFKLSPEESVGLTNSTYPSIVKLDSDGSTLELDRSNECNWTVHARQAISRLDRNAVIIENRKGELHFETIKEIETNCEIKVGYGDDYAKKHGFHTFYDGGPYPESENSDVRHWLDGDIEDERDNHEEEEDECDREAPPPGNFQDYVIRNELYAKFEGNGCLEMEKEFEEFEKKLSADICPPCTVRSENNGFIPFELLQKVPVIRPTFKMMNENKFESFAKFIQYKGWHYTGLTKIIPPAGFINGGEEGFVKLYKSPKFKFHPHKQTPTKESRLDIAQLDFSLDKMKVFDVQTFYEYTTTDGREMLLPDSVEKNEELRKSILTSRLFCKDIRGKEHFPLGYPNEEWDMKTLDTFYSRRGKWTKDDAALFTRSSLSFGMFGSRLPWQYGDFGAWTLNYVHYGHPVIWSSISPLYTNKWIHAQIAIYNNHLNQFSETTLCPFYPTHGLFCIEDNQLNSLGIPTATVQQEPGTYIMTHDYAPHTTVSTGFNATESVRFGIQTKDWPRHGIFENRCLDKKCSLGLKIKIHPLPIWLGYDLLGKYVPQYLNNKNGTSGYHPYGFQFGKQQKVVKGKHNDIQPYFINNLGLKTEEIGNRLRGILSTPGELGLKSDLDIRELVADLEKRDTAAETFQ